MVGWVAMALGALLLVATAGAVVWVTRGEVDPPAAAAAPPNGGPEEAPTPADPDRTPAASGAASHGLPAGATEIDRPENFPYATSRVDCTAQTKVTDELKKVALDLDRQIREGSPLSWEEEKALGDQAIAHFEEELGGKLVGTGAFATYIEQVARPLLAHVSRKDVQYRFYLWENTDTVNALALPGGHVVISRPLYDRWLENEAELATVVGHEIGHVDLRHPVAVAELLRAMRIPEEDVISQMLTQLARIPYSTAIEERADRFGAEAVHGAGYSVFQAVKLWEERAKERNDTRPAPPANDPIGQLADLALGELENLATTHPAPARRACLLKQISYELFSTAPKSSVYVGYTNLGRRVPLSERAF